VHIDCLNKADYDDIPSDEINPYLSDPLSQDGLEYGYQSRREPILEHPCSALKKLLSGGTFYYSVEFDLTNRLQDRSAGTYHLHVASANTVKAYRSFHVRYR
jgi:hypothetical protein